jgi:hypothetical protein
MLRRCRGENLCPQLNRLGRSRQPDHLHQRNPGGGTASYFLQESHAPAVNPVAGLKPEMEAQTIDGRHSGFVGSLASKPAGDQTEGIGVIRIHVLDDSWRGLSQRVG